jgi:rare lipoprotein A
MNLKIPVILVLAAVYACSPSVRENRGREIDRNSATGSVLREGDILIGQASYYADEFHGRKTASGEIFNMYDKTAAHKYLPFNTLLKVTNQFNERSVIVRINDRGPFTKDRIIDLSYQAAKEIDMLKEGIATVKVQILRLGSNE